VALVFRPGLKINDILPDGVYGESGNSGIAATVFNEKIESLKEFIVAFDRLRALALATVSQLISFNQVLYVLSISESHAIYPGAD